MRLILSSLQISFEYNKLAALLHPSKNKFLTNIGLMELNKYWACTTNDTKSQVT